MFDVTIWTIADVVKLLFPGEIYKFTFQNICLVYQFFTASFHHQIYFIFDFKDFILLQ